MRKVVSHLILVMGVIIALGPAIPGAKAQSEMYTPPGASQFDMYCSGVITDQPVPGDMYVISGENSVYKTSFYPGDFTFINQGADHGVKVGDQFEVVRAISDPMATNAWFKYQAQLIRAMGTRYKDIGRLRVIHVDEKVATAVVALGCDPIQRGDIVRPFVARPVPQFHDAKLDPFAPPSGKKTAMIVSTKDYMSLVGPGKIAFVNLGSAQGVRVGDYFRAFRYQGTRTETVFQVHDTAFKAYGFGSAPVAYEWDNLPRQALGEAIVLRTGPNSSTVLVTTTRYEIFVGDYVELE